MTEAGHCQICGKITGRWVSQEHGWRCSAHSLYVIKESGLSDVNTADGSITLRLKEGDTTDPFGTLGLISTEKKLNRAERRAWEKRNKKHKGNL